MKSSLIPWHVFLDATKEQPPSLMENWLRRWLFTNDGVVMAHSKSLSENNLPLSTAEASDQPQSSPWATLKTV
jgi:hypothetical protein